MISCNKSNNNKLSNISDNYEPQSSHSIQPNIQRKWGDKERRQELCCLGFETKIQIRKNNKALNIITKLEMV